MRNRLVTHWHWEKWHELLVFLFLSVHVWYNMLFTQSFHEFLLFLSVHGLSPVLLLPVHVPGGEPSHSQLRESGRQQGECHCRLKISIVYLHLVNFGFKEHQPPLLIILSVLSTKETLCIRIFLATSARKEASLLHNASFTHASLTVFCYKGWLALLPHPHISFSLALPDKIIVTCYAEVDKICVTPNSSFC